VVQLSFEVSKAVCANVTKQVGMFIVTEKILTPSISSVLAGLEPKIISSVKKSICNNEELKLKLMSSSSKNINSSDNNKINTQELKEIIDKLVQQHKSRKK
jgi:hypothetical protein